MSNTRPKVEFMDDASVRFTSGWTVIRVGEEEVMIAVPGRYLTIPTRDWDALMEAMAETGRIGEAIVDLNDEL